LDCQLGNKARCYQGVLQRATRHRKHLSMHEFAFLLRCAFEPEIFLFRDFRERSCGHCF
jgi:hypothetical protein